MERVLEADDRESTEHDLMTVELRPLTAKV
jgi:hypothetical protein